MDRAFRVCALSSDSGTQTALGSGFLGLSWQSLNPRQSYSFNILLHATEALVIRLRGGGCCF
jgi:hypothetical protein